MAESKASRALARVEKALKQYDLVKRRPWSSPDDVREAADELRTAVNVAQDNADELGRQARSEDEHRLRGNLIVWATLGEGTLKETGA